MAPDSIHAESTVEINDSCNQCCCFGWKRKPKKETEKAARQVIRSRDQESPRRIERHVTQIHLDKTITDDIEFVQDYKISPGRK